MSRQIATITDQLHLLRNEASVLIRIIGPSRCVILLLRVLVAARVATLLLLRGIGLVLLLVLRIERLTRGGWTIAMLPSLVLLRRVEPNRGARAVVHRRCCRKNAPIRVGDHQRSTMLASGAMMFVRSSSARVPLLPLRSRCSISTSSYMQAVGHSGCGGGSSGGNGMGRGNGGSSGGSGSSGGQPRSSLWAALGLSFLAMASTAGPACAKDKKETKIVMDPPSGSKDLTVDGVTDMLWKLAGPMLTNLVSGFKALFATRYCDDEPSPPLAGIQRRHGAGVGNRPQKGRQLPRRRRRPFVHGPPGACAHGRHHGQLDR